MVESDLEGPWVKADHAFDAVARMVPEGDRVFTVLSSYDDVRFFVERAPGYEPGDTLMLIAPLLIAHGANDRSLRELGLSPENTRLIPDAREVIAHIKEMDEFYIISTSYEQYVESVLSLLGAEKGKAFYTRFPVDDLSIEIRSEDAAMVREWTRKIARMPTIHADESGHISRSCIEAKEALDEFFWEVLPRTSFSILMESVKPVGGKRKYEALLEALARQGKSLDQSRVVGDSITDCVMLSEARASGALALSFNGNRYSIRNSNVAVLSESCWATAAVIEIHRQAGLEGLEDASGQWDRRVLEELKSKGLVSAEVCSGLVKASAHGGSHPRVFWLEKSDVQSVIRESEAFRKRVRGRGIGVLG